MKKETEARTGFSLWLIVIVLLFSLLYSVIRYHIAGGVPWEELPFFIMNKAISLNGIILLILTFTIGPLKNMDVKVGNKWMKARKALGMAGFISIFIHMIMSLMLFSPAYYAKFFDGAGRMAPECATEHVNGSSCICSAVVLQHKFL